MRGSALHKTCEHGVVYTYEPRRITRRQKKKKTNFIALFFALLILGTYGYFVCPYNFKTYIRPVFLNRILNRNLEIDAKSAVNPSLNYLYNSSLFGENLRVEKPQNTKEVAPINMVFEMTSTRNKLLELFKKYPRLAPSVYVWEYETGGGLEIAADEVYPSASIIKLPLACAFMRMLDYNPELTLNSQMTFTEKFRTDGSGFLKKTRANRDYTLDDLARVMITHSDNTATNMILYTTGGVDGFNRTMRNLGFQITSMQNWLPDLAGTNKITAKEVSTILYNIDNPKFINPKYKSVLKEYLVNTKNTHLLKEKLPADVMVLHKTGDIGTMLGDAGIVYTNNGRKYIVTILVKRPHNDYGAKILIQEASSIIYNDIKNL